MTADYLLECNNPQIPESDFTRQFCVRCQNTECQRSRPHGSRFDQRVATWEDRLFLNVPRLDPQDPQYEKIANQDFPQVGAGWGEPLQVGPMGSGPAPQAVTPVSHTVQTPETATSTPGRFQGLNTPTSSGIMLGPGKTEPSTVSVDPWAGPAKQQVSSGEVMIKPGAKIKMGTKPPAGV